MVSVHRFRSISQISCFLLIGLVCCISLLVSGCTSQEKRWDSPILAQPQNSSDNLPSKPGLNSEPITLAPDLNRSQELIQPQVERPYIPTPSETPGFENGWIVNTQSGFSLDMLASKAEEYGVTFIQLGGDILQAVDELILNEDKRRFVQQVADQMELKNIKVLVESREIHLEGRTFLFDKDAPLVAARQAAYRKALHFIPQLAGVVITFKDAFLPPWDAVISEGRVQPSNPERIRFLLDMIRPVVIEELGKRLYVRLDGLTPQQQEWVAQAVVDLNDDRIIIQIPADHTAKKVSGILANVKNKPHLLELDLAGKQFGGPQFIAGLWDEWNEWRRLRSEAQVRGTVITVQNNLGSLLNSPNEINLLAFSQSAKDIPLNPGLFEAEWIQKRYAILPMTREGNLLSGIFSRSTLWNKKMAQISQMLNFSVDGDLPDPAKWSLADFVTQPGVLTPAEEYFYRKIYQPERQTMIDLAQESQEAIDLLDQSLRDLESIHMQMNTLDYNDLYQRIEHQRLMADVFLYAKQSIFGFVLWKNTKDEDEALYLEAHLQKLERLADTLDERYGLDIKPGNSSRIREWVQRIRSEFPRVMIGWRERVWNALKNIVIRQTGPANVEIGWTSAKPAQSRIFLTTQLPVFDRMVSVSNYPVIEHKAYLGELEVGKTYYIKMQITSENGEVTNSGVFSFELESSPLL